MPRADNSAAKAAKVAERTATILDGTYIKGHARQLGSLRIGKVNVRIRCHASHVVLLYIFDHADDFNVRLDLAAASESEMHPNGIAAGEKALDHRFTCHRDFGAHRAVSVSKFAARQKRYSKSRKVTRADGDAVNVLQILGKLGS